MAEGRRWEDDGVMDKATLVSRENVGRKGRIRVTAGKGRLLPGSGIKKVATCFLWYLTIQFLTIPG